MHWPLPTPRLLVAAIVAFAVLALLRGEGQAWLRRLGEAFIIALGVTAVLWVGWFVLWLIEQWW